MRNLVNGKGCCKEGKSVKESFEPIAPSDDDGGGGQQLSLVVPYFLLSFPFWNKGGW